MNRQHLWRCRLLRPRAQPSASWPSARSQPFSLVLASDNRISAHKIRPLRSDKNPTFSVVINSTPLPSPKARSTANGKPTSLNGNYRRLNGLEYSDVVLRDTCRPDL